VLIAVFANDKSLAVGVVKKRLKPVIWGLLMDLAIKLKHLNGCVCIFWGAYFAMGVPPTWQIRECQSSPPKGIWY
jgi:hypothetical protein